MIIVSVPDVRRVLGEWGASVSDDDITAPGLATMIEAEISSACSAWMEIVDPAEIEKLDTAISYLAAARLITNIGGIKSMTLGDQAISYNSAFITREQSRWRRDALSLVGSVCPIQALPYGIGIHFGKARGRRG